MRIGVALGGTGVKQEVYMGEKLHEGLILTTREGVRFYHNCFLYFFFLYDSLLIDPIYLALTQC